MHARAGKIAEIADVLGNREAAVFKEITKMYEEVRRGTLEYLVDQFDAPDLKGEYTIIVSGMGKKE